MSVINEKSVFFTRTAVQNDYAISAPIFNGDLFQNVHDLRKDIIL